MVNALFGAVFELQGIKNLVLGLKEAAAWGLLVLGEILISSAITAQWKLPFIKECHH
jgi:hypothetical protein